MTCYSCNYSHHTTGDKIVISTSAIVIINIGNANLGVHTAGCINPDHYTIETNFQLE